jgi:hypothetical protein
MKTCLTMLAALGASCAMSATAAAAQGSNGDFAVGANIGTPGVGVQASAKVSDLLVVRGALDGLSLSRGETLSDIHYDGKARLLTGGLFADVHPGGGGFFLSGGAYVGKRKVRLTATPTADVEIGDETFTPAEVGRLDGRAKLSKLQPFVGLGFDNTFVGDRGWGFRALAGVSFSKRPRVTLTASGGALAADPDFQAQLAAEEADVREDAKDFKYFPVVQLGLTRRF